MVPEMLRRLLPVAGAHRAFASLSRLTFGNTGAILMFHEVQEDTDGELRTGCSPGFLEALVRGLIAAGWDIVTLEEALRRIRCGTGNRFVVITFDDGYRDTFSRALPILERYSAPFTVYVPTAAITRELNAWWLGLRSIFRNHDVVRIDAMERKFVCPSLPAKVKALRQTCAWIAQDFSVLPMLCETFQAYRVSMDDLVERYCFDRDTLKRLARNPLVTIGGHTSTHRPLSFLNEDQMVQEIRDNRAFLEGLIDTKVEHLSYPYGTVQACGEREFAASLRLGFLSAVTAEKNHRLRRHIRLHRLPRVDVTGRYWRAICNEMSHGVRTEPSTAPRRIARETHEMSPLALLTPTYGRDLSICTLLCESVDCHVKSFSKHYLLVPDSDAALFAPLASERRIVIPASTYLPGWLRPLPRVVQRKRRQFWWSLRAKPVSGWHVQQFLKIAATISLPHERYCILDSDIVFFRDFDLARFEYPNSIPLLTMANEVTRDQPWHSRWVDTSHQLLGLPTPPFPAADFIGHIIFWDKQTTRALIARIEEVTGVEWIEALCRTHVFAEYMLYGYFVQNDPASALRHAVVPTTPCVSYWDDPTLSKTDLTQMLRRATRDDVAFSIASFSGTPVDTIRAAIAESDAILAPAAIDEPKEPAALC